MKLAYVMELTALAAFGTALARWHVHDARHVGIWADVWLKSAGDGFFSGAAVIGSLGLFAEVASGRSPRPWGPGRWVWSIVGLYVVSRYGLLLVYRSVRYYRFNESSGSFFAGLPEHFRVQFSFDLLNIAPVVLIAVGLTRMIAGPKPERADAREWAGRIFALLLVISGVGANLCDAAWH